MFARISAKVLILTAGAAMLFFGIGLLGLALASALTTLVGTAGAYAISGAVLVIPVVIWALVKNAARPPKPATPPPSAAGDVMGALFSAIARETPVMAVVAAAVAGAANMFLNRHRSKPNK